MDRQLYFSEPRDSLRNDITNLAEIILHTNPSDTGYLAETVIIKVGALVMLIKNINITDGLANLGYSTVIHIVTRSFIHKDKHLDEEIQTILVRLDHSTVGTLAKQNSLY